MSIMSQPAALGRGRKIACEMCRARKRRCDGQLPSCSLCHKAQFHCIYAIQGPYTPSSGAIFRSMPRSSCNSPAQADMSTPVTYDFSRHFAGDMDLREQFTGIPSPMNWSSSGSEISYNLGEADRQERHSMGWMQQSCAPIDMPPSEFAIDVSAFERSSEPAFDATDTWQQCLPTTLGATTSLSEPSQSQLPSQERVLEMVNSFFSAQHQLLPSVHKASFMARLSNDMVGLSSGPFLWVILALYCSCNKSESMQGQYRTWMQTAHMKLEHMSTTSVGSDTTNVLQASIWMVFDAYCRGDVTNAWLLLGRTAQLTNALGLDRIDNKRRTSRMDLEQNARSDIEVEECRKCMWCLRLLDCVIVSVNGLALSVDDRYFHVNFPLPDDRFQDARGSIKDIEYLRENYSLQAFDLLNGNTTSAMATKPSFDHILKVTTILGRALASQNSVRDHDDGTHTCTEKLRTLESVLNTFSYAASASGEDIGPTSLMQLWLKMFTQCSKILMLHPPGPSTLGLCDCLDSSSPRVPPGKTNTECVRAAMNAAGTFCDALEETLLALNNPFLLPMACTSVRMLTLLRNHMHESDRKRTERLIVGMLKVVDYIAIKFPGAAVKARETIIQRVNEPKHGRRRDSPACYVGLDCE